MGVEFNLKVIKKDGVNLFELVDGDVRVHFDKFSAELADIKTQLVSVVSPKSSRVVGVFTVEADGDAVKFVCLQNKFALHARVFDVHRMADTLEAKDFKTGQFITPVLAREVKGHDFSAAQLVVGEYRAQQMAKAKLDHGSAVSEIFDSIPNYQKRLSDINTITKAAVQVSDNPPTLIMK